MRKWLVCMLAMLLLCGCGAQSVFETVDDEDSLAVSAAVRQILIDLPKEAAKPVMESAGGDSLYLCDGYTLTVQTLAGGEMNRTMQQLTGFGKDQLQYICTRSGDAERYDLAWTSAGEGGDQVARGVILDDGQNHYAVCVMADAADAAALQKTWQKLLNTVALSTD